MIRWPRAWWFSGPGFDDSVAQGLVIQWPRIWWFSGPGFGDSVAQGLVIQWPRVWWLGGPGLGDSVAQGLVIQWPRAWWFSGPGFGDSVALGLVIQDSNWVCCWDGAWHQQLQNLHLIIPFQYVLRCQLFTCLNILPCWFDNSCYLIGSQKPIRQPPGDQRESSTNMQKNYSRMWN